LLLLAHYGLRRDEIAIIEKNLQERAASREAAEPPALEE
jgi:hypothetical protein